MRIMFPVGVALACVMFAQPNAAHRANGKSGPGLASPLRQSSQGLSISAIFIGAESFNPTRGEKVTLNYTLSRDATTAVKVFDADRQLVRAFPAAGRKAGKVSQTWDGKDLDGKVVPNEAYFFTIEAQ